MTIVVGAAVVSETVARHDLPHQRLRRMATMADKPLRDEAVSSTLGVRGACPAVRTTTGSRRRNDNGQPATGLGSQSGREHGVP